MRSIRAIGCCLPFLVLSFLPAVAAEKVDFNFEVRPLLSDRCFKCHGPDDRSRMAKLRLDSRESALRVIKPGDAAGSEVLRRLTSSDPAVRMPPPWSNLTVTEDEIALIRRWIEQGAEYRPHWSFIPVAAVEAPAVKERGWPRNGIDNFVLARLERE